MAFVCSWNSSMGLPSGIDPTICRTMSRHWAMPHSHSSLWIHLSKLYFHLKTFPALDYLHEILITDPYDNGTFSFLLPTPRSLHSWTSQNIFHGVNIIIINLFLLLLFLFFYFSKKDFFYFTYIFCFVTSSSIKNKIIMKVYLTVR